MSAHTLLYISELDEVGALTVGDNVRLSFNGEERTGVYLGQGEKERHRFGYRNGPKNMFSVEATRRDMVLIDGKLVMDSVGHTSLSVDHPDRTTIKDWLEQGN